MKIFLTPIKIYFRVLQNYKNISAKKSNYFYIYSMPLFGIPFFILSKILLKIKNIYLINFFLEMKIFKSSIRFLNGEERHYIANTLKSYNTLNNNFSSNNISDQTKNMIKELKENGFCSLGKIFSDDECDNFIKSLENKNCFNSQTPMQSDGKIMKFQPNDSVFSKLGYYVFLPEATLSYVPIQKLLNDKNINFVINSYLNFKPKIYCCMTWFNPITQVKHYDHRLHRDTDDYRFVALYVYWNKVTKLNGSTSYVPKSHRLNINDLEKNKIFFEGEKGSAFLIDLNGFHAGNMVTQGHRYVTNIRFGKEDTYSAVVDGFIEMPKEKDLEFMKKN